MFNLLSIISFNVSLIVFAPWLPPKIKITGKSFFKPIPFFIISFCACDIAIPFIFVGVPVTTTFFAFGNLCFASSKPTKIVSTFFASILVATPGKALLSCSNVGILYFFAAIIVGPQINPPVPITISGLKSFTIFFASPKPFNVLNIFFILLMLIFLFMP